MIVNVGRMGTPRRRMTSRRVWLSVKATMFAVFSRIEADHVAGLERIRGLLASPVEIAKIRA